MRRAYLGAALVVAGIAALIEADSHAPRAAKVCGLSEGCVSFPASGLSRTAYDLIRIGGWALVVFGIVVAVLGLIAYRAAQTRA